MDNLGYRTDVKKGGWVAILAEVVKSERCEENANNFQLPMRGPVARITACQSQCCCSYFIDKDSRVPRSWVSCSKLRRQWESKVRVLATFLNHSLPSKWMVCYSWPSADFPLTSTPSPNPSTGLSTLLIWFCALYQLASLGTLWVLAANFVMRAHTALASMRASLLWSRVW